MTLELHIHEGTRSPNGSPHAEDGRGAPREIRTADEGRLLRARSLELARELLTLLSDPRTRRASPTSPTSATSATTEAELSIASSLASHVVDILAAMPERA